MKNPSIARISRQQMFLFTMFIGSFFIISKAGVTGMEMHESFGRQGNDDIMRLLSVRDWLGGQRWYDVVQYRLMPPEGVSLHWSRYIDAGIAAIIVPFSWVMSIATAEAVAVTVWPTIISISILFVVGFGTRRVFGPLAACFAVLCTLLWPLASSLHASAGSLDHHNIQMLLMMLVANALIWPSRPVTSGIVGGLAAAFSLAVGLESLVFMVGAGLVALLRASILDTSDARRFLLVFCAALAVGSVLLWLGQAGPSTRMNLMCDQLAPPTLALVGIASTACIGALALARWTANKTARLGGACLITLVGLLLASPLLSNCLAGPYAQIPHELQELITNSISEAKPFLVYAHEKPAVALVFSTPIFVAIIAGALQWQKERELPIMDRSRYNALGVLLLLCVVGLPMMFVQMRAVIIAASVVPMIAGPVIAFRVESYLVSRNLKDGIIAIVIAVALISPTVVVQLLHPVLSQRDKISSAAQSDCRGYSSLVTLNELPPATILTHLNFGPALMWATHHSSLAAPYHRSAEAFLNGIVPFQMEEADFVSYVRDTTATHLLLCRGFNYQSEYVRGLASGGSADWLRRVPVSSEDQLLFEILR